MLDFNCDLSSTIATEISTEISTDSRYESSSTVSFTKMISASSVSENYIITQVISTQ